MAKRTIEEKTRVAELWRLRTERLEATKVGDRVEWTHAFDAAVYGEGAATVVAITPGVRRHGVVTTLFTLQGTKECAVFGAVPFLDHTRPVQRVVDVGVYGSTGASVFLFFLHSAEAVAWWAEHVHDEGPGFGAGYPVEHRYVGPIVEGLVEAGFNVRRQGVSFGIYVNSRHGGFTLKEAKRTVVFATYAEAEAGLEARGYVQSTAVDRDSLGRRLKFRQVTAYVITVSIGTKEVQQ